MAKEIERKFLLKNDSWKGSVVKREKFSQGYLIGGKESSVRVRIEGDKANINIKSATLDISRLEYEYEIPLKDAEEILDKLCQKPFIEKYRNIVEMKSSNGNKIHKWEIDEFLGENDGLVVAEIELSDADEVFVKPDWVGKEVSDDPKYYNVCLVKNPYKDW